jgi:enoyl-CoA hydratase/carnithine racemase
MERDEHIARITFNRQEKRNAMSTELTREIRAALRAAWDCTVVTISGGDGPAFCAGADLSAQVRNMQQTEPPPWTRKYEDYTESWERTFLLMWEHPAVVIASVNGYCLAGGGSILSCCDLAIASDRAQFGITEMGFGSFGGFVTPLISKTVRKKHIAQLNLTAERIDAETAHRFGMINWIVPHEQLKEKTERLAQRIGSLDPVRVEHAKRALNMMDHFDWTTASHFGGTIGGAGRNITNASENRARFLAKQGAGLGQGVGAGGALD